MADDAARQAIRDPDRDLGLVTAADAMSMHAPMRVCKSELFPGEVVILTFRLQVGGGLALADWRREPLGKWSALFQ